MGLRDEGASASVLLMVFIACAPAAAAELYKWVDERGVTNYSNTPPPRTKDGKPATVVEDRLSIYTPEEPVTEAIERARARPAQSKQPSSAVGPGGALERRPTGPPPGIVSDPCANSGDPNCRAGLYDGFPVFQNRRHPAPLAQPQLPPGTAAGNVTAPDNYIPGHRVRRRLRRRRSRVTGARAARRVQLKRSGAHRRISSRRRANGRGARALQQAPAPWHR